LVPWPVFPPCVGVEPDPVRPVWLEDEPDGDDEALDPWFDVPDDDDC
jgi:hypothetical protein